MKCTHVLLKPLLVANKLITRRAALGIIIGGITARCAMAREPGSAPEKPSRKKGGKPADSDAAAPITGKGKANSAFDAALLKHLQLSRATAATFTLEIEGAPAYSRGYGWLDADRSHKTLPTTPMRVASISKPITAAAIRKLVASDHLTLDAKAWPLLQRELGDATPSDERWKQITIQELLEHKGGWDIKELKFDPMFESRRVRQELGLDHPPGPVDVIRWMLGKQLSFAPGERSAYSNFGYCVLGRVIESISRKPYLQFIRQEVGAAADIPPKEIRLGYEDPEERDPREPWYNENLYVDWMDAHGGVVISSPQLCKFLDAFWISGEPRSPGQKGYVYTFFGSMPGTSAISHQRGDGVNFACAFNGRHGDAKLDELTDQINKIIDDGDT